MGEVELTGQLVCQIQEESDLVARFLPAHVELTRAEAGCLLFEITQKDDPLVWQVGERFSNEIAFKEHQKRVAASEWGQKMAGIARDYKVTGLAAG